MLGLAGVYALENRSVQKMVCQQYKGFTLTEALISMGLLAFITMLSVKLLEPPPKANLFGRKAADVIQHLVSAHHQAEITRGRPPLTPDFVGAFPDLDGNPATPEVGFAVHLMQAELQTNYCAAVTPPVTQPPECSTYAGRDFLDYPGGIRLYLRPEQFPFVRTALTQPPFSIANTGANYNRNTVMVNNRYKIQNFLLLDMDNKTVPTGLPATVGTTVNSDVVLLYINDDSGTISSVTQETEDVLTLTPPLPDGRANFRCTFYDVYKNVPGCGVIGNIAT
jgi:hypothetical protein